MLCNPVKHCSDIQAAYLRDLHGIIQPRRWLQAEGVEVPVPAFSRASCPSRCSSAVMAFWVRGMALAYEAGLVCSKNNPIREIKAGC